MTGQQPGKGFAMVPAWLVWKRPSETALMVYVHLALFGTFNPGTATYEQCRPSKRTLAHGDPRRGYPGTGLSESTVGRALRELESLGAIRGEPAYHPVTGAQLPTVYRLIFGQVSEGADDEPADQTPVSPVTPPRTRARGNKPAGQPPVSNEYPPPGIGSDTPPVSDGNPPPGIGSDTQPITLDLDPDTNTPPTPTPPSSAAAVDDQPATQGGTIELDQKTREILNAAVDQAVAERGTSAWSLDKVRAAVREQLAAGEAPNDVAVALGRAASDRGGTAYPGRLAWWLTEIRRQAAVPGQAPPPWVEGPRQYLPADTPRCRHHQGEPADGCNRCAAEAKAAADGIEARLLADRLDAETARQLARRAAASNRRTGARNAGPGRRDETSPFAATMARLDAELAKLHATDQADAADAGVPLAGAPQ